MPMRLLRAPQCRRETKEFLWQSCALATANRRTENIGIAAIIVAELKLRDIERQIFAADLVVAAHDPAFQDRPEALNRIGVDCANDVLSSGMIDNTVRMFFAEIFIDVVGVCAEQANFVGNGFLHKGFR